MWMNEHDVNDALRHYAQRDDAPNYTRAAHILAALVDWTNDHSDGWPYWGKPSRAASKLTDALHGWRRRHIDGVETDLTADELAAIVKPVKAFLTRQINDPLNHWPEVDTAINLRDHITAYVKEARA